MWDKSAIMSWGTLVAKMSLIISLCTMFQAINNFTCPYSRDMAICNEHFLFDLAAKPHGPSRWSSYERARIFLAHQKISYTTDVCKTLPNMHLCISDFAYIHYIRYHLQLTMLIHIFYRLQKCLKNEFFFLFFFLFSSF